MVDSEPAAGGIHVIAGPNGGGKSSVGGEAVRAAGSKFFNPDEYARRLRELQPGMSEFDSNSGAWAMMRGYLERAIQEDRGFAFETTLGGNTIPRLLREAALHGRRVCIWYVALASPEMHISRVAERVASGGHAIPEDTIRARYDSSRANLIDLLPLVKEVRLFDNSVEWPDGKVKPLLVLHVVDSAIVGMAPVTAIPEWAKPIVAAAIAAQGGP